MFPVTSKQSKLARSLIVGLHTAAAALCLSMITTTAQAQYQRTDLVSNQAGVTPVQDQHLVNGWGLVSLPTSPFWVSDNGTGFSTLYTGAGAQVPLVVAVPAAPPSGPAGSTRNANRRSRKHPAQIQLILRSRRTASLGRHFSFLTRLTVRSAPGTQTWPATTP